MFAAVAAGLIAQPVTPSSGNSRCVPALTLRANSDRSAAMKRMSRSALVYIVTRLFGWWIPLKFDQHPYYLQLLW